MTPSSPSQDLQVQPPHVLSPVSPRKVGVWGPQGPHRAHGDPQDLKGHVEIPPWSPKNTWGPHKLHKGHMGIPPRFPHGTRGPQRHMGTPQNSPQGKWGPHKPHGDPPKAPQGNEDPLKVLTRHTSTPQDLGDPPQAPHKVHGDPPQAQVHTWALTHGTPPHCWGGGCGGTLAESPPVPRAQAGGAPRAPLTPVPCPG